MIVGLVIALGCYLVIAIIMAADPLVDWSTWHEQEDARRVFAALLWPVTFTVVVVMGIRRLFKEADLGGLWNEIGRQSKGD